MKSLYKFVVTIISFFSFVSNVYLLENIKINDETLIPYFDKETYVYNYYTDNDNITISIVKEENETVKGNGTYNLKDGLNEFKITSTINENSIQYSINVFKNYKKEEDKTSSLLKNLNIENYNINFNSLIFDYEITINEEESLIIDYETVSEYSGVKIIGNSNLNETNNLIKIIVTSADNLSESTYNLKVNKTINVFKEEKETKKTHQLNKQQQIFSIVLIILIGLFILSIIFYLLFIRKRHKKQ